MRIRTIRPLFVHLLLVGVLLSVGARSPASLSDRLDALLDAEEAQTAFWGIYVRDLESGKVLYARNADKALMPASNQKLFTTATALDALGRDYRYQTTLYLDGEARGSVLQGDLILEGAGDPSFGSYEFGADDPLRRWAEALAAMGVSRIEGRIIGDDDVFDDLPYAPGWDIAHVTTEKFAPARGGLAYQDNIVQVRVEAAQPGEAPAVETEPAGYFEVQNQATTSSKGGGAARIDRRVGADAVRLYGAVPRSYEATIVLPISNPTAMTLHAFRQALDAAGIEVAATLHDVDDLSAPQKPDYTAARPLFVNASPTLAELVKVVNKESNNLYAEQVFHTFGWSGTSEGGEQRVKALLARFGVQTDGLSIRDGSGLSRKDLTTPEALGALLVGMAAHEERDAFLASLAEGGEPGTTLQYRLRGADVQAKTGSLDYARTLSGYATSADGRRLVFVVMANNYTAPSYRITQLIDSLVLTLTNATIGTIPDKSPPTS